MSSLRAVVTYMTQDKGISPGPGPFHGGTKILPLQPTHSQTLGMVRSDLSFLKSRITHGIEFRYGNGSENLDPKVLLLVSYALHSHQGNVLTTLTWHRDTGIWSHRNKLP